MALLYMEGFNCWTQGEYNYEIITSGVATATDVVASGGPYTERFWDGPNSGGTWVGVRFPPQKVTPTKHVLTINNNGAESGTSTGWTTESGGLGVFSTEDEGPHSGTYYFYGGSFVTTTVRQDVALPSSLSTWIDSGKAEMALFWWQNSLAGADDGDMQLAFFSSAGSSLSTTYKAGITAPTTWTQRSLTKIIPATARTVRIKMNFERDSGTTNDCNFDDISAYVKVYPAPRRVIWQGHVFPDADSVDLEIFDLYEMDESNELITLSYVAGDNISVKRGATTILTSTTGTFTTNTWHYVALDVYIHDTDGFVKVVLNGTTEIDSTGIDTNNTTNEMVGIYGWRMPASGSNNRDPNVANVICMSTEGTRLNSILSERRIVTLLPTTDTTDADWSLSSTSVSGASLIDDVTGEGSTTWIYSASTGAVSRFQITDLGARPVSIDAIGIKTFTESTLWGLTGYVTFVQGGTATEESTWLPSASFDGHMRLTQIVEDDPNSTAGGWTVEGVQNLSIGIRLESHSTRGYP